MSCATSERARSPSEIMKLVIYYTSLMNISYISVEHCIRYDATRRSPINSTVAKQRNYVKHKPLLHKNTAHGRLIGYKRSFWRLCRDTAFRLWCLRTGCCEEVFGLGSTAEEVISGVCSTHGVNGKCENSFSLIT